MRSRADTSGARLDVDQSPDVAARPKLARAFLRVGLAVAFAFAATWLSSAMERVAVVSPPVAERSGSAAPSHEAPLPPLVEPGNVESVASYELTAHLDPVAHEIVGDGTLRFVNVSSAPLHELYVHLYLNAFDGDESVFMRRDGAGFRGSGALSANGRIEVGRFFVREMGVDVWPEKPSTDGDPKDRTDIRVPLPRAIAPGETIHVDMRFLSKLPSVFLRTGFAGSFHMVGQWFPKLAKLEPDGRWAHFPFDRFSEFYADFGDYDVTVDVPEAFVVGATGGLVDEKTESGRRVVRYREKAIHDFAFTAWDRFQEKRAEADGVELRCLFPPGHEESADAELEATRRGLAAFGELYGAYPYRELTIVHPPEAAAEAGGMEYPTLITTGGPWWLPRSGTRALELLTLHELAHQWFYGLVATNENASPFLDEGLTTFAAGSAAELIYRDRPLTPLLPISVGAGERIYAKGVASRAPVASAAPGFASGSDYARLVYYRTTTILRTLDLVFPGSATRALRLYARRHRFGHPGPADLEASFSDPEARAALHAALFDEASIDLRVMPFEAGAHEATVTRKGTLALPVLVEMTDVTGEVHRTRWNGAGSSTTVTSDRPILSVVADPEGDILLDENLLDNGFRLDRPSSPRLFFTALFGSSLVTQGVLP